MFKIFFSFVMLLFAMSANAAVANPEFNLLSITDSYNPGVKLDTPAADVKFNVGKLKNGIYLSARSCGRTQYPKVAAIIKSIFEEKGIRIVENPLDADLALTFCGSMFENVDNNKDAGINKEHAIALIGTAIFTGGLSLIAEDWRSTTRAGHQASVISVFIAPKPFSVNDSFFRRGMIDCENESVVNTTLGYFAEKDGEKNVQIGMDILVAYAQSFVANHFVFDKQILPVPGVMAEAASTPVNQ